MQSGIVLSHETLDSVAKYVTQSSFCGSSKTLFDCLNKELQKKNAPIHDEVQINGLMPHRPLYELSVLHI